MGSPIKWADPDGLSFFGMQIAVESKMAKLKCHTIPPAKGKPRPPSPPKISPTKPFGVVDNEYRCEGCCNKFRKGMTLRGTMECFGCRMVNKEIEKANAES